MTHQSLFLLLLGDCRCSALDKALDHGSTSSDLVGDSGTTRRSVLVVERHLRYAGACDSCTQNMPGAVPSTTSTVFEIGLIVHRRKRFHTVKYLYLSFAFLAHGSKYYKI